MKTFLFYIANVLLFAIPLGLFEVYLERFKSGWDGEFFDPFWGKKINVAWMDKAFEKTYVTPYHIIMFGIVFPGIIALEYLGLHCVAGHGWWRLDFWGISIIPLAFIPAVLVGNMVFEDFLWFVFNSYCWWFKVRFPDALAKLFRGEFKWHTKWIDIPLVGIKLPRFYIWATAIAIILLIIQEAIIKYL